MPLTPGSQLNARPHDLPSSELRPLVSLIVLSFNQERYIRAAIDSALAQTYHPLEIILSDDCSMDDTFKIMTDIAANYDGPHTLRTNRCEENLGVFRHFQSVLEQCGGDLIVMSAGDDISLPHRVETLVEKWRSTGASVVGSSHHEIDEEGAMLKGNVHLTAFFGGENLFLDEEGPEIVAFRGATGCYDTIISNYLIDTDLRFEYEDFVISYIANKIRRPPVHIDEPLVLYRRHASAATHFPDSVLHDAVESEQRALRYYKNRLNMLRYIKLIDDRISSENEGCRKTNWKYIDKDIEFIEVMLQWDSLTTSGRIKNILASLGSAKMVKWKLFRLFGKHPKYYPARPMKTTLAFLRNASKANGDGSPTLRMKSDSLPAQDDELRPTKRNAVRGCNRPSWR